MQWSYRTIRRNAWNTTFKKGLKPWFLLVIVCFIFSYIGAYHSSQTSFVASIDKLLGADPETQISNVDYLEEYISDSSFVKNVPFLTSELAVLAVDSLSRSVTWVVRLLAANLAYFQRNPGEVIAQMLLAALITAIVQFFIQNILILGFYRYTLENRVQYIVRFSRLTAPFHKEHLWNQIRVMFLYDLALLLWSLTIVGGIIKYFQYYMVPYILAENPSASWKEAKKLSSQMTKGYKWKLFVLLLSYTYIWILEAVPVVGLLVAVPLSAQLDAEIYLTLRQNPAVPRDLFTEPAFDAPLWKKGDPETVPDYRLEDLERYTPQIKGKSLPYPVTDIVFMFFSFCLAGWLWEVGLHLVQSHEFVNRGTLYGPWIPIYGVGGAVMVILLDRVKANKARLFIVAVLLCAVLEYLTSFFLDILFNSSYWDYKNMSFNLNGRICLAGLLAFGFGGLFGVYVAAPSIHKIADRYPKKRQITAAAILVSLFAADIIFCILFGFNTGAGVGGSL